MQQSTDAQNPRLKVYAIRDTRGETFNLPFMKHTHGEAERDFVTVARSADSMISKFPEDFDLYYLGQYEQKTGKLFPVQSPEHICNAATLPKG